MTANPITRFETPDHPKENNDDRPTQYPTNVPASLDLMTAARLLGIGRTCAYGLVSRGHWPTPVIRVGRCIRIPTQPLLTLLDPDLTVIHSLSATGDPGRPPNDSERDVDTKGT